MNSEYNSWNHYDYSTGTTYSSRKKDNSEYQRNSILAIQQKLNRLGYKGKNGKKLVEDGLWGTNTEFAHTNYYNDLRNHTEKTEPVSAPDDEVLNKQLSNLVDQMADNPTPSQKVPQSIVNSTHAQSVMNNKTLSQQQVEENFQRIMDAINPPDYGKQLTDLLNPKKQKVTQSVANSTHAQSILNDKTLSQPQQEDYLQRLMDALEAKNKEHEAAKKSTHSLDFILNPETNTNKSQTERENEYTRALQQVLRPGQTESQYRYSYWGKMNSTAKSSSDHARQFTKTLDDLARSSPDPLYVLERRLDKQSSAHYSQQEREQIFDRALQQILPFGMTENGYRQRSLLKHSLSTIKSPLPDMTSEQWQKTVFNMRIDGANLDNWAKLGDSNDPNNCYFWALGIWISQQAGWKFSREQNAPGVFSDEEISLHDIQSILNSNGSINRQKLDALTERMGKSLMLDAAYLGYNVRCLDNQLWDLNLTDADARAQYEDYITMSTNEQKHTKIDYLKSQGQQVENSILAKLSPNETLIVMAIDPHNENYPIHFFRRDTNGLWSEKPGHSSLSFDCPDPFITPELRTSAVSNEPEYKIIGTYAISDPQTTLH